MPLFRSVSYLRKKTVEISKLARRSKEPIFITKNGKLDMVVMSLAQLDALQRKLEAVIRGKKEERR